MEFIPTEVILKRAKAAASCPALRDTAAKNRALAAMAQELRAEAPAILAENAADLEASRGTVSDVMLDRLALNEARLEGMAAGIEAVSALPDPVGRTLDEFVRPDVFFLILAVMYCRVLTRRFSWPFTLLGLTVGYLLYIIPTKFMPYADAERMLFGLVTFPLTPIVLFRDKWYKSLLCAFAGLVAMAGSDLLSVSWLLTPEQLRQGLTFQPIPVQLAVYAIFLSTDGLLMFLFTLLMNRYQNRLSGREWALYLAFPASQYLLIYGWVIFLRTDFILRRVLMLLLALAICTAADALLFTAIRGMAQRSELKARNDLLARQIDRQNEHYAALTAQYENLRRIRHDISSHLYTMQLLLQEGQYDEAAAYSAEVTEACRFRSDLGACENPVVDAFLFSRTEELRAQGYTLQLQVCIPAETGIRNADMVVAFGNLLDNAAEACRDAGEKRLSLSARMDRGFLCIEVRNPAPAAPARHSRRIPELERGIGSHILRALAETYEGSYALTPSGGECTASLLLKGAAA